MSGRLTRTLFSPVPLRISLLQRLLCRLPIFPYPWRMEVGAVPRPQYGYCILQAARLARKLGYPKISVLEFGVAGGAGLLAIEDHVTKLEKHLDVEIQIFGFDTGQGLPKPTDYRDLPYHWKESFFKMEKDKLQSKLKRSTLVFGDIRETVHQFSQTYDPAPIGCVFFDMDYYSSTAASLDIFRSDHDRCLPRVFCYFDDVIGTEISLYNEFTGELLAIQEFNNAERDKKIARTRHLRVAGTWHDQIYIFHDFLHPRYCQFVSSEDQQAKI